jgi:ferredoxin
MMVEVDWDRCEANGVCMRVAPEVFHLDDKDRLHVLREEVTPELREKVERAVRTCPRQALALTQK